jgi:glycosyltransferase involved in cell wall biosynthesis
MKVGIVLSQFGSILKGGAEIQAENTVKALKLLNIDILYVNQHTNVDELKSCDIIHFFKSENYFSILANILVNHNIPYVVSSVFFPENRIQLFKNKVFRFISLISKKNISLGRFDLWDNASYIFPNTHDEARVLEGLSIKKAKLKIIKNAIENEYFINNGNIKKQKVNRQNRFVLNVGRIEPRKRQFELIKVCKRINIPLVLVGDIRDNRYWEKCLSLNFDKLTHYNFSKDKNFLKNMYKSSSVFCLPSTMETPGLAALEAYSQGVQIVVTKNGGAKDYFMDSAFYVDPYNENDIYEKVLEALSNPKKHKVNFNSFKYSSVAEDYIKYYKKILDVS